MDVFSGQGLVITIMIVLTAEASKRFGLTKVGSVLFSFVIAVALLKLFQIESLQSQILIDGVPGVL